MRNLVLAATVVALALTGPALAGSVTTAVPTITVQPAVVALGLAFTPATPISIACAAVPGTVLFTGQASGGDGNPVSFSMSGGDGSVSITNPQSAQVNVVVAAGGVLPADCGHNIPALTVTATQS